MTAVTICGKGWRIAIGWTIRGSNVVGVEILSASPDGRWDQPSLLYHDYRMSFPKIKWPKHRVDQQPLLAPMLKSRLYLYSLSRLPWPVYHPPTPTHSSWAHGGTEPPHYSASRSPSHTTIGMTPLDGWSARRRDLHLTTHCTRNRQTLMS